MTTVFTSKEIRSSSDWLLSQNVQRQASSFGRLGEGIRRQESRQFKPEQRSHLTGFPGEHLEAVPRTGKAAS